MSSDPDNTYEYMCLACKIFLRGNIGFVSFVCLVLTKRYASIKSLNTLIGENLSYKSLTYNTPTNTKKCALL